MRVLLALASLCALVLAGCEDGAPVVVAPAGPGRYVVYEVRHGYDCRWFRADSYRVRSGALTAMVGDVLGGEALEAGKPLTVLAPWAVLDLYTGHLAGQ